MFWIWPDQALALAAALVPVLALQVGPAHLVPVALVPLALAPRLPAPLAPRAPAADGTTTAAAHAQSKSLHRMQSFCNICYIVPLNCCEVNLCLICDSAGPKHRRGAMIRKEGKEARAPNQLNSTWAGWPGMSPRSAKKKIVTHFHPKPKNCYSLFQGFLKDWFMISN